MAPIFDILYDKAIDALYSAKWPHIVRACKRFILAVLLSLILIDMGNGFIWARSILSWQNYMVARIMVAFAIVYGREYIPNIDFITRAIRERFQDIAPKEEAIRIAGVSIDELADFLWSGNTIGRKQLMDSFALSRSKSDAILEALEGASILVRGKNNARVISDNALRSDIIHTLSPLKTSEE